MEKAAGADVLPQGPKIGDRVAVEGVLISFLSGGKEARVRLDNGMPFSPAVISAAPKSLTVVGAEEFGPCIGCGRQQTRNPHPDAGEPGHEGAGYAWHCVTVPGGEPITANAAPAVIRTASPGQWAQASNTRAKPTR